MTDSELLDAIRITLVMVEDNQHYQNAALWAICGVLLMAFVLVILTPKK